MLGQKVLYLSEKWWCADIHVHYWNWYQKFWSSRTLPVVFKCFSGLRQPCAWKYFLTSTALCQPWALLPARHEVLSSSHSVTLLRHEMLQAGWTWDYFCSWLLSKRCHLLPSLPSLLQLRVCVRQAVLWKWILSPSGYSQPVRQSETSLSSMGVNFSECENCLLRSFSVCVWSEECAQLPLPWNVIIVHIWGGAVSNKHLSSTQRISFGSGNPWTKNYWLQRENFGKERVFLPSTCMFGLHWKVSLHVITSTPLYWQTKRKVSTDFSFSYSAFQYHPQPFLFNSQVILHCYVLMQFFMLLPVRKDVSDVSLLFFWIKHRLCF